MCGEPRPDRVHYCRSCGHYDTWWERRPLPAAIRQIFIGTILVGLLGIGVQILADALIKDSDERQAERERKHAASETLHEQLNALRESLIRIVFRMTNDTIRCPFAGAEDGPSRCIEHIRELRQELRQELFALDWTAPLLFAQLDAMGHARGQDAPGSGSMGDARAAEAALDISTTVGSVYQKTIDRLDMRWARECTGEPPGPECDAIQKCRSKYASAETRCVTFAACLAFRKESDLIAYMIQAPPYETQYCSRTIEEHGECGNPSLSERDALPGALCGLVLARKGDCAKDWSDFHARCEQLGESLVVGSGLSSAELRPVPPAAAHAPQPLSDPDPGAAKRTGI